MYIHIFPMLICIFLMASCSPDKNESGIGENYKGIAILDGIENVKQAASTAKMISLVGSIYDKIDPLAINYFANSERADMMKESMETQEDPVKKTLLKMRYGMELISAGKNANAVVVLEQVIAKMKNTGSQDIQSIYRAHRALAIAYLRIGEVQNCLKSDNEKMCIVPLEGEGIYKDKSSVRRAISTLNYMLQIASKEKEAIWLLNFAHMANGDYPAGVPAQYLIPEKAFDSDYTIDRFRNIGAKLNVDIDGLAGGAIMDDFNNDGFLDLVSTSWGEHDGIHYMLNNGKGEFENVSHQAGLNGMPGGLNINQVDFNNDGFLDIFIMRGGWYSSSGKIPNSLLRNEGDGTFTDVTEELGLLSFYPTQTSVWQDFNLDGLIDLFIANESSMNIPCNNELFMQQENGTFKNIITKVEGLNNAAGFAKGCAVGDVNNDGLVDVYLSYCGQPNKLLLNTTKNEILSFIDIAQTASVVEPIKSFPTWFFDFNNDGYEDILVADFGEYNKAKAGSVLDNYFGKSTGGQPRIYLNNKDNTFTDKSIEMGVTDAIFAMGSNYGDLDNDGYLDFYLATGSPNFTSIIPNRMFRNNQGKEFQDVSTSGGFGHVQKGHAVAFGDLDNDGDQDVFCVLGGAYEGDIAKDALFLNPGNENAWVSLKLVGFKSNRAAIGARIQVKYTTKDGKKNTQFHTVGPGSSFGSNSLQVELGLSNASKIDEVLINWPNKLHTKSSIKDLELNTFYKIYEEGERAEKLELVKLSL